MKTKILLSIPFFALLMSCGEGKTETYYDNDQVKERWSEAKNEKGETVKNGTFEAFDEKGNKRDSVNYVMGSREGVELKWYPDAKIRSRCSWLNNQYDGKCEEFGMNGKIQTLRTYTKGIPNGAEFIYNEKGVKIEEKFFKMGIQDSIYQRWNDEGLLKQISHYKEGKLDGEEKIWCDEEKYKDVIREQRNYVMGKRNGVETYYLCLNGELSGILNWKDEKMDGPYTYWEEDKKIVEVYKEGKCVRNCPKPPEGQPQ
jgi:antitoxin component YwqK of YwqJK toxin-antitoxin module